MLTSVFLTKEQRIAAEIMGKNNFFGIEENINLLGVDPTEKELSILSEIPYNEATLNECREDFFLMALFSRSVNEIRELAKKQEVPITHKSYFPEKKPYVEEPVFVDNKGETKWLLLKKSVAENFLKKSWPRQHELLKENEEVPTTREVFYILVAYFLLTGEWMFGDTLVRCSDRHPIMYYIPGVGVKDGGPNIFDTRYFDREDCIGLAISRKTDDPSILVGLGYAS